MKKNEKYNIMKVKYLLPIVLLLVAPSLYISAQSESPTGDPEIQTQTLTIYTDHTIAIQEANRIQFLPEIIDTIKVEPEFHYSINPTAYSTKFNPTPINAASLKEEPKPELDKGLIKIGAGNYLSPYIEFFYNSTYSSDYTIGAYAKHHSINKESEGIDGENRFSGFNYNTAKIYASRFMRNAVFDAEINFESNEVYYYGFDLNSDMKSDLLDNDKSPPVTRDNFIAQKEHQRWMTINPKVSLSSAHDNRNLLSYDMMLNYYYLFNITDDYHHGLSIAADFSGDRDNNSFGMLSKFVYHNDFLSEVKDEDKFLHLNPYFRRVSDDWQITLGLNTTTEFPDADTAKFWYYPNVRIQHNISNTIIPFVSFRGYLDDNCINSIQRINPFVVSMPNIEVTNYAQVFDLGFRGYISRNVNFQLSGNYSKIDNKPFFINDTSLILENKFILEYSNIERFSGYGEINLRDIYNFNFLIKAKYNYYSYIRSIEKPWHKPELEVSFITEYQYTRDIKIGAEAFFVGKRYAKDFAPDENASNGEMLMKPRELSPFVDFNIYGEYIVASNFSTFLKLNNLLNTKQYNWNNYHSVGFNFMLGLQYKF